MTRLSPCKRYEFIRKLRKLGFDGPYIGTKHSFMIYNNHRLAIPSHKEYSAPQLKMLLREIENIIGERITLENWNTL